MATSKRSRRSVGSDTVHIGADASTLAPSTAVVSTRSPPLLRKSSSTGLLDGVGTPPDGDKSRATGDVFPKLRRRSSSLQDLNEKGGEPRRHSEKPKPKKSARQQQNRRASGWDTPQGASTPLPQLTVSATQSPLSAHNTGGRPKRSKRAGDIELTREATINVVVKYQRACTCLRVEYV